MARSTATTVVVMALLLAAIAAVVEAGDNNRLFQPCADTKVQRFDGFTFGIAFAAKESFVFNQMQLSPCDSRLNLVSNNAQISIFRPKVDEISLLTINTTTSVTNGGFMVAFAGKKYAARSFPAFVGNSTYSVTSFTLVLEFHKGTLQNLYWKRDGCASCSGKTNFVCLNKQNCAIRTSTCKSQGGQVDCNIGIQTAFSGTDKHDSVLNSWYEVSNLKQYSLFGLYSNLRNSLTSQFNSIF